MVAIVILVTATVAIGVDAFGGNGPGVVASQYSPKLGTVPSVGSTPADVLSTLAKRLPLVSNPTTVAETIPPPPGSDGIALSGIKVTCDLAVSSFQGAGIAKALWERDLFMGAVRAEFAAQGFGNVIDGSSTLVTPDGSKEPDGGGVSENLPTNQVYDAIPPSLSSSIAAAASAVGFHSVQTDVLPVIQDALVITVVSDSPSTDVATFLHKGGLAALLGQSPANFEGVYFEVDNGAGVPVYISDTAPRDGGSSWWADPSTGITGDYSATPPSDGSTTPSSDGSNTPSSDGSTTP